jgi:hypothetical protein
MRGFFASLRMTSSGGAKGLRLLGITFGVGAKANGAEVVAELRCSPAWVGEVII